MIQAKKAVEALKAYQPPLEGRREFIRLDFNENTVGFPDVYEDWTPSLITAYPEYTAFLKTLAHHWQLPEENILLTNGSDEGLFVIALTFIEPDVDRAIVASPTFALIPHYLKVAQSQLIEIPFTVGDYQYDIPPIEEALNQGVKMVMFASPDNPVGATLPVEITKRWCEQYPHTLFVMDEAYAEYSTESAVPLTTQFDNLLVTRTFSKAWGLAGLRLGIIIGNPRLIELLSRVRSPYSVNALALQTAQKMLEQKHDIHQQAAETMQRKAWVLAEVKKRGYQIVPGKANFFMMNVGLNARGFCQFFRNRGILLRDRSSHPLLAGMVRISIGNQTEMEQFLQALDEYPTRHVMLFDMDGTLVDTSRSFDATVAALVEKYSEKPLGNHELGALRAEGGFNDDWEATVELLRRRGVSISFQQIAQEATDLYLTLALQTETWLADPERLSGLKSRYRLGVVTGRYRAEFDPIWKTRFESIFELVVCQDDHPQAAKKPEPDLLHHALEKMGAEHGLYIGNSVDDMRAARAAGLAAVAVTTTHDADTLRQAGAELILNSLHELEGLLLR